MRCATELRDEDPDCVQTMSSPVMFWLESFPWRVLRCDTSSGQICRECHAALTLGRVECRHGGVLSNGLYQGESCRSWRGENLCSLAVKHQAARRPIRVGWFTTCRRSLMRAYALSSAEIEKANYLCESAERSKFPKRQSSRRCFKGF